MATKGKKKLDNGKKEVKMQEQLRKVTTDFFENLGLLGRRLSLQDALTFREKTLNEASCSNPKQLPLLILQKIMAYDFQSRTSLLNLPLKKTPSESDSNDDDSNSDNEEEESEETDLSHYQLGEVNPVHPVDGILALFYCADDFLRQDMMVRLSSCQLAIPLVLRDPFTQELNFPLWALSAIVKSWRTKDPIGKLVEHENQITECPMPIISFIRLGKHKKSKSKLLNDVISNSHYDHFFHRDCNGGQLKHLLGNGLIDMCWYLPGGKEDVFPNAIVFLNLHGNACSKVNKNQVAFLSQVSSMCFALVAGKMLDGESAEILKMFPNYMLAITGRKPKNLKETLPGKVKTISLKKLNADEVKTTIREAIKQKVFSPGQPLSCKSIKSCVENARALHMHIDEDTEQFKVGHRFAVSSLSIVTSEPDFKCKSLPLQGKNLWQEWAKNDKEQYRQVNRGAKKINPYTAEIKERKNAIRKQQSRHLTHLSPLMKKFITNLQNKDKTVVNYFLYCLKLGLNNRSRDAIADVHRKYRETRSMLRQIQMPKDQTNFEESPEEKRLRKELDALHGKLIDITFGFEHLLREVGQVYETLEGEISEKQFLKLPMAAAQLLISGYPLEVMDGDAAHVPIKWVTAVLNEAASCLKKDPRVFILSVLGLQSTGKSTLLNTTFGLQFNVSSGRCTRGAYMQLLPISEELRESVKCDYVLVVDTEGLRAPELDPLQSQKHDNELATFVIGLANETLINIYGEVAGDMDDILQTAVHAFIRMRTINLKPSCQFIHQNAGAGSKIGIGQDRFIQKLNQMTRFAAKEEKCEHQFKQFSDVIKFDDLKDVHHFECLWMGDPPMAPINLGYSKSAQSLKSHLIDQVKSTPSTPLSSFSTRMKDLWEALLKENFVFSFKNGVEINAYNALETKYSEWECKLKDEVLELGQKIENEIIVASESCDSKEIDKVFVKWLHPVTGNLLTFVNEQHNSLKEELMNYFKQSKQSDVIAQWKSNFERKLGEQAEILKHEAVNRFQQLCDGKKALTSVRQQQETYKQQIINKVGEIATDLKRKGEQLSEKQLQEKFRTTWEEIIRTLPSVRKLQDAEQVTLDVERELVKFLGRGDEQIVIEAKSSQSVRSNTTLKLKIEEETHITKSWAQTAKCILGLGHSHITQAQQITDIVLKNAADYLWSVRNKTYNPTYTTKMLQELKEDIDCLSEELSFTRRYRVDVYLTACNYATKQFERMVDAFNRANDPVVYLETELKDPLYTLFRNTYLEIAHEKAVASALSDLLTTCIEKQVKRSLGLQIVMSMRPSGVHFSNKQALKAKILVDLAENLRANPHDFHPYIVYLTDPKQSFRYWAREYTRQYCENVVKGGQRTQLQTLAISTVESLIDFINSKITELSTQFETLDTLTWLTMFSKDEHVVEKLGHVDISTLNGAKTIKVTSFSASIKDELKNAKKKAAEKFQHLHFKDMEDWEERAEDILGNMAGCCAKCPFCGEICDNTHDHCQDIKHYVEQHRPDCVGGWRDCDTKTMGLEICTTLVTGEDTYKTFKHSKNNMQSHPYREYSTLFPDWHIPADLTSDTSKYWKWFVANFASKISDHYSMKLCSIPRDWDMPWSAVKAELEKKYK